MAASRSMLEALLARVQKRAQEPRGASVHIPPHGAVDVASIEASSEASAVYEAAETLPPQPAAHASAGAYQPEALDEEDIEEYDEELIEIIDDADVIPQAAAAARAIEPGAFGASLERRGGASNGTSAAPLPAVEPRAVTAPPVAAPRAATAPPAAAEPLRPESVAARPVAAAAVIQARGARRELRAQPFLELLDASLQLGG